jgi:hypothetical protein
LIGLSQASFEATSKVCEQSQSVLFSYFTPVSALLAVDM